MRLGPSRDRSTSTVTSVSRVSPLDPGAPRAHRARGPRSTARSSRERRRARTRSPATPSCRGELEVRVAIADHEAARGVDGVSPKVFLDHAELGLAAAAALALEVRADEYGLELDPLRGEQLEHEPVRSLESLGRQTRRAEPVLVGDHDQLRIPPARGRAAPGSPRAAADLVEPVDLLVRRLLDQRAVAIDEQNSSRRSLGRLQARDQGVVLGAGAHRDPQRIGAAPGSRAYRARWCRRPCSSAGTRPHRGCRSAESSRRSATLSSPCGRGAGRSRRYSRSSSSACDPDPCWRRLRADRARASAASMVGWASE